MTAAKFDIEIRVHHIQGKNNEIADLLSRWHLVKDPASKLSSFSTDFQEITITDEFFSIDYEI